MKETRKLSYNALRELCINRDWYSRGTNEDYQMLLEFANSLKSVETEHIVLIAENILRHSYTDYIIADICFEIAGACQSFFE